MRIQSWTDRPADTRHLGSWLSPRDGLELVHRCLVAPDLGFAVIGRFVEGHGVEIRLAGEPVELAGWDHFGGRGEADLR